MATYTLGPDDKGVWEKTLAPGTPDRVELLERGFDPDQTITVINESGAAPIWVRVDSIGDATAIAAGSQQAWRIPDTKGAKLVVHTHKGAGDVNSDGDMNDPAVAVKLLVVGATPTVYSVMGEK